jgi:hypothetical protein
MVAARVGDLVGQPLELFLGTGVEGQGHQAVGQLDDTETP